MQVSKAITPVLFNPCQCHSRPCEESLTYHHEVGNQQSRSQLPSQKQRHLPDAGPQETDEVLRRFLFEPDLIHDDCTAILKAMNRNTPGRKQLNGARIASLQSNPRVHAWLT